MPSQGFSLAYNKYLNEDISDAGFTVGNSYFGNCGHKDYWEDGCTESRVGYTFEDYYRFRPEQAVPKNHNHVMYECQRIYREHGIVRNILELMVDFTTGGIKVSHPQKNMQRLGRKWFKRVKGLEVSTQFNLGIYLFGTNIIDPYRSKLTLKQKNNLKSASAKLRTQFDVIKKQGTVPTKYVFLNPVMITTLGGCLNQFIGGEPTYGIKVPLEITQILSKKEDHRSKEEQDIIDSMPKELVGAIKKSDGYSYYKLDRPLEVYHYRKLNWEPWANPIIMSIYKDLRMLEQMQLADMAALDAAINQITIIRLGNIEHELVPNKGAFQKLKEALAVNTGGGQRILTWGPDIDIIQSNVEIQKYLDSAKYAPVMERIYGGLGIPPSMTASNVSGGSTNNLVSLRGFIERLEYGRGMLIDFWEKQFDTFAMEMGIKTPFQLEFDIPNLGDVEVEKKLFIELWDRGVISNELILRKFNAVPELEKKRTIQEKKDRDSNRAVPKGGPFDDPQLKDKTVKTLVEQGQLPVDELGIKSKIDNKIISQDDMIQPEISGNDNDFKQNRKSINGRPPGSIDTEKRQRNDSGKPVLKATKLWAKSIQKNIAEVINPIILQDFNKKNMRSLNTDQCKIAEYIAIGTLFNMEPDKDIAQACSEPYNDLIIQDYNQQIRDIQISLDRKLTADEKRDIAADLYAEKGFVLQ